MVDLSVQLGEVKLDNPIIPASGTFGYGAEFSKFYDINVLGSFAIKGTTKEPRFGNETPRIAETPSGMLNSVGLQNPGVDHVIKYELEDLKKIYKKNVIANVSGFSIDEYKYVSRKFDETDNVSIIEVNISCPNIHGGGMSFGTSAKCAAEVTRAVKLVTRKPVFVKLSPNVKDITEIALACEDAGADGLTLINTVLGMRIDIKSRKTVLANKTGGLSGDAIFPIALRMVYEVTKKCKIPVIGCGGVSCADDVIEMMMAGASAVQIGAANLVNPYVSKEIIEDLPNKCKQLGIKNISDIVGVVE